MPDMCVFEPFLSCSGLVARFVLGFSQGNVGFVWVRVSSERFERWGDDSRILDHSYSGMGLRDLWVRSILLSIDFWRVWGVFLGSSGSVLVCDDRG